MAGRAGQADGRADRRLAGEGREGEGQLEPVKRAGVVCDND